MDYKEALKAVTTKKPKDNYMVVELDYSLKLLLPFKDGLTFMTALNNAELLETSYSKPTMITPIERDKIKSTVMSCDEYERIKIAALLQITPDEVKEHALKAA